MPTLTYTYIGLLPGDAIGTVLSGNVATSATVSSGVNAYTIGVGTLTIINANYMLNFVQRKVSSSPTQSVELQIPIDANLYSELSVSNPPMGNVGSSPPLPADCR